MGEYGVSGKDIKRTDTDDTEMGIQNIYTVKIPEGTSLIIMNQRITRMVTNNGGSVFQGIESSSGRTLTITLGSSKKPTDVIILKKSSAVEVKLARMAIIIDDVGVRNLDSMKRFCALDQTVTLSILPFRPYTAHAVKISRDTQTPYMLHLPMQPKSSKANPGEGVLLERDDRKTIHEKLEKAFKNVTGAKGFNNHMGSRATENVRVMESVMEYLSKNNLFFVDSKTSLNTVGYNMSTKQGVKSAIIDGFLDVKNDRDDIERRLTRLTDLALQKGRVIVIGHDRPLTLSVLEQRLPELEKKGITFVPASDLIR